jgi:hypothetical protein
MLRRWSNLMNATPQLRPMTIGDMFDAAFRLYRAHFLTFIGIVALLQVPMAILQFMVQFMLGGNAMNDLLRFSARPPVPSPGQNPFASFPLGSFLSFYLISLGVGVFQYLIIRNLVTGALANAIARSLHGQPTTILGAYGFGARRYVAMILASLVPVALGIVLFALIAACTIGVLTTLGVQLGERPNIGLVVVAVLGLFGLVLLVIVASIFVYTRLLLTPQAIVLEDQGALAGIRRSWRLVGDSFWRAVAILLLMGILAYLISSLPAVMVSLSLTFASRGSLNGLMLNQAITTLVAETGLILALPLQLAVYTLLYYDLRVRKEGYDIEVMAQQTTQS